jgi:hypothetical protein
VGVSAPWWLGFEPAEAIVECGGARHRVRWEAGALSARDHDDLEGERALTALGGERCVCAEVVDAWARHAEDVRVLVAGRRGPADRIPARDWGADDEQDQFGFAGGHVLMRPGGMVSAESLPDTPEARLMALLSLPGALPDRLVATVAAAFAVRDPSPSLHAALYGRVLAVLGELETLSLVAPGGPPSLTRDDGGRIHAALPFAWVSTVWARGLATILGRFCLSAKTADGRDWTLLTVGPDFGPPEAVRLTL